MTWIKLDDKAPRHPKVSGLTDRAFRWWILALCYASEFLTDGLLPPAFYRSIPKQVRSELTGSGLWEFDDPNLKIHDYLGHQSSKEVVTKKKADTAERVAKHREVKRNAVTSGVTNAVSNGAGNAPVTPPDTENREQRTDPENREQTSASRSSRAWGASIIAPGEAVNFERKHGRHLEGFCDWCCFPMDLVERFANKIPGADEGQKRHEIKLWAESVRVKWEGQIIPDGSDYDFWTNRWTETHGGSRPANATLKAATAERSLNEAFK